MELTCESCGGSGFHFGILRDEFGRPTAMTVTSVCSQCHGSGRYGWKRKKKSTFVFDSDEEVEAIWRARR